MIQLRPYQTEIIEKLFKKLILYDSVLVQSATGSGKTVIMASFIKKYLEINPNHKILVSVHREELVSQTSEMLIKLGILNEKITAKSKPSFVTNVYVGMTQTIWARKIKLNIDLMIIDEAHEQIHNKTFDLFNAKRIGFTATPIINKRRIYYKCDYCDKITDEIEVCCYNEKNQKYSAPITMSELYKDIIIGPEIKQLIEEESLVDEICYTYNYYENLEAKGNDDFDENEIANESIKHDQNVLEEYEEKAKGKKTMIFTASTKQNLSLVSTFKDYPIKSYDSVNNNTSERMEIVKWFKETEGAILVSTGTFTTGFDVREVECIIINRPTQSLSLWHQIVGRGARTTTEIYKPNFIVIDLGGNITRLGKWSDYKDWKSIFFNGLIKAKKRKKQLIECEKCSYNFVGYVGDECEDCGYINKPIERIPTGEGKATETERTLQKTISVSLIPLPNGKKIAEFVKRTTNSKNDYYKILIEKYVDLWKYNQVSKSIYLQRKASGKLENKIMEYLQKNYYYVNYLDDGVPRTYDYLVSKIVQKLEACYM